MSHRFRVCSEPLRSQGTDAENTGASERAEALPVLSRGFSRNGRVGCGREGCAFARKRPRQRLGVSGRTAGAESLLLPRSSRPGPRGGRTDVTFHLVPRRPARRKGMRMSLLPELAVVLPWSRYPPQSTPGAEPSCPLSAVLLALDLAPGTQQALRKRVPEWMKGHVSGPHSPPESELL